jgi:two-component system, OmpR family, sensor histidine kinase TctE
LQLRDLRLSLHARIIAFIAAILAIGAVVLGLAAWQYARIAARDAYDTLLVGGVIQVAENVYVQGGVVTLDPPAAAFATLSAYDLVFYKVVDPRGVVVAGYEDLDSGVPAEAIRRGVVLADGSFQGQPVRIATIGKQIDDPQAGGWSEIVVAQTLKARGDLAFDLTAKAIGIIAAMSLLALIAGALSVRLALAPLARIERDIAGRRPDDLRPIQVAAPLEVRTLVGAIDGFMHRLADRIAIMQRFIADAAHQIRTPLAALDAQTELLSQAAGPAEQAAGIERLRERSAELGRLTSQLLSHAMIIHRIEAVGFQPVDLNALAKSVLAQAVPLSLEREVSIAFIPCEEDLTVAADPISLREALTNLIHNALKHGAPTRLAVRLGREGTHAFVAVCDDGPGIPASDQERLLGPFQVGAGSSSGSGLGLAIAADVARAHGGGLTFETASGQFCVRLTVGIDGDPAQAARP